MGVLVFRRKKMNIKDRVNGKIVDFTHEGKGVLRMEDFILFVEGGIIGDLVEVEIKKLKKNYGLADLIKIIEPSEDRVNYFFDTKSIGGGAPLIDYDYEKQLVWKREKVKKDLMKIANINTDVLETIGMDHPFRYRNHTQVPVGEINKKIYTGYFKQKTNEIIPMEEDYLQREIGDKILESIRNFLNEKNIRAYDRKKKEGLIKHIGIRTNENQEAMVIIVTKEEDFKEKLELVHRLVREVPGVISVYQNISRDDKNTYGKKYIHLFGREKLTDYIGELKFHISPNSFFQVNPSQVKVLYQKALDYLEPREEDIVYDLYSGIGTISLFIADRVKQVIGIEYVEKAVENANENIVLNNKKNVKFYQGKAEEVFPKLVKEGLTANKLILDPPRKGCEKEVIDAIIKLSPKTIVYVSCDSSTMARDVKLLVDEGYQVKEVQPVDMFCHSSHVETVVLLSK